MATAREVTQFSMVEFNAFKKSMDEMGASFQPTTPREKYMAQFAVAWANMNVLDLTLQFGGRDNVQRVRVVEELGGVRFDFVLKLPLAVLEEKRRQEEREQKAKENKAILAKVEALKAGDPKMLREFVQAVAYAVLGRMTTIALLESLKAKPAKKPVVQKVQRKTPDRLKAKAKSAPKKDEPLSKEEAFKRAIAQDRRNRIETAKKGQKWANKSEQAVTP